MGLNIAMLSIAVVALAMALGATVGTARALCERGIDHSVVPCEMIEGLGDGR